VVQLVVAAGTDDTIYRSVLGLGLSLFLICRRWGVGGPEGDWGFMVFPHLTIACNNQFIAAKMVECRSDECGMWILSLLRHGSLNATPANALRKVGLSTFTTAAQGPMRRQQT
jgi:hypothetical protein